MVSAWTSPPRLARRGSHRHATATGGRRVAAAWRRLAVAAVWQRRRKGGHRTAPHVCAHDLFVHTARCTREYTTRLPSHHRLQSSWACKAPFDRFSNILETPPRAPPARPRVPPRSYVSPLAPHRTAGSILATIARPSPPAFIGAILVMTARLSRSDMAGSILAMTARPSSRTMGHTRGAPGAR